MISGQKIQETIKLSENSKFLSLYEKVEKNNKDYKAWKAVLDVLDEEVFPLPDEPSHLMFLSNSPWSWPVSSTKHSWNSSPLLQNILKRYEQENDSSSLISGSILK